VPVDGNYDRQLVIDVLAPKADGSLQLVGSVDGYDPGSGT
jgi:hypothetical protein